MAAVTETQKPTQTAKLTLYWLDYSRAHRILWLLEELKLEYELKVYNRLPSKFAPPELKEIHPLGKSPILGVQTPGMEKPRILIESGFIVEYLLDHYGQHLIPQRYPPGKEGQVGEETEEWVRHRTFMQYAEGSMMPPLLVMTVANALESAPLPFFLKPLVRMISGKIKDTFTIQLATHFEYLESLLATSPQNGQFLCGPNLTGADIMMIFPLDASRNRAGLTEEKYPKLYAYVERLLARDAWKRGVKKAEDATGQPFSVVLE